MADLFAEKIKKVCVKPLTIRTMRDIIEVS